MSKQKKLILFVGIFILLVIGGVWCVVKADKKVTPVECIQTQRVVTNSECSSDEGFADVVDTKNIDAKEISSIESMNLSYVDISDWETYRSDSDGFEVKYPAGMIIKEVDESEVSESVINRYVVFSDQDNNVNIYFGVKKESEGSVMPKPYRTGIPGGEFFSRGVVPIGNGIAEEKRLINCYFKENRCVTELVWFCDIDDCDNFSVGNGRIAFVEVIPTIKTNLIKMEKTVHGMIRSFKLVE